MTLRCHLLGHKRSHSRAAYDEKNACWFSECRRCHTLLIKEWHGSWHPAPPQPRRLVPLPSAYLPSRSFTIVVEQPRLRQVAG